MSHSFVRRRLWWKGLNRALADFGNAPGSDPVEFHWVRVTSYIGDGAGEIGYRLFWENEEIDRYETLTALKTWLIQSAYGVQPGHLIPSELLFDAGLGYFNVNIWVDAWCTPDPVKSRDFIIVEGTEDIEVPRDRCIHLVSDGNTRLSVLRRRATEPVKHRSKVRALTEEIDRVTEAYSRKYGARQAFHNHPTRRDDQDDAWRWERYEKQDKSRIYPKRAANGSNFSPVSLDWQDLAWEARCNRVPKEVEVPDEECFFIVAAEKD